jgi:hypothetical protein
MTQTYVKPELRLIGSVAGVTAQQFNKIGLSTDIYTALTNGAVIGSLVPVS